ncbi:hypothetical protein GCM10022261_21050 [Brevibacterium daeguense]|uniref:Uncharacterized protein n=1 Tax=Brevibacterium daeguense TaxID=909936 RepID=A0ABP8EKR2_9MICO
MDVEHDAVVGESDLRPALAVRDQGGAVSAGQREHRRLEPLAEQVGIPPDRRVLGIPPDRRVLGIPADLRVLG